MDLIHKIESLRYDIENGVVTDVISISVRLIQIKDQALQLQQTDVISSRIKELEEENKKLHFMIKNALGYEDMVNDCL